MLPVVFNEKMFDDLFDSDFFGGRNPLYGRHAKNLMKTDIREKEDGYEMAVDLPGFNKDEIKVEIKDGYMTVSANKDLDKDEADKKGRVIRRERYVGTCSRTFYVGDIKPEVIMHSSLSHDLFYDYDFLLTWTTDRFQFFVFNDEAVI